MGAIARFQEQIQRPDTHEMIVVHRVFRRESDLMPTLIRAVPEEPDRELVAGQVLPASGEALTSER